MIYSQNNNATLKKKEKKKNLNPLTVSSFWLLGWICGMWFGIILRRTLRSCCCWCAYFFPLQSKHVGRARRSKFLGHSEFSRSQRGKQDAFGCGAQFACSLDPNVSNHPVEECVCFLDINYAGVRDVRYERLSTVSGCSWVFRCSGGSCFSFYGYPRGVQALKASRTALCR